jgi:dynein heavy chain 1
MREYFTKISNSRNNLEQKNFELLTTSEAVAIIQIVQEYRKSLIQWETEKNVFNECERMLERQRYHFPDNWLYSDNIHGEFSSFVEILSRKENLIKKQVIYFMFLKFEYAKYSIIVDFFLFSFE